MTRRLRALPDGLRAVHFDLDDDQIRQLWAQSEPCATVTIPTGRQLIVCLACSDTLRTSHPMVASIFRDWHLIQHKHVEPANIRSETGSDLQVHDRIPSVERPRAARTAGAMADQTVRSGRRDRC